MVRFMYAFLLLASSIISAEPLPDGSLLFLENCNKFVEVYTRDEIGHVAMVFRDGTTIWVYEATPGEVRRVTLAAYYDELARINDRRRQKIRVLAYKPKEPYSAGEVDTMRGYLDEQIGRRYSLLNYVTKQVGDGTHCAELTANTINHAERFALSEPNRVSPGNLRNKIAADYQPAEEITLPTYEEQETWCERTMQKWASCSKWCRWSWGEAWALCW